MAKNKLSLSDKISLNKKNVAIKTIVEKIIIPTFMPIIVGVVNFIPSPPIRNITGPRGVEKSTFGI